LPESGKIDHTMPFRLLQYMVEVWRDAYNNTPEKERKRKGFRLPAIVPAILYNGEGGWTARRSFREYQPEPWEVDKMITNIERTLDEMQRQASLEGEKRGKAGGKIEGKVETARAALSEGLDVDVVCRITGLSRETVMELKRTLEN